MENGMENKIMDLHADLIIFILSLISFSEKKKWKKLMMWWWKTIHFQRFIAFHILISVFFSPLPWHRCYSQFYPSFSRCFAFHQKRRWRWIRTEIRRRKMVYFLCLNFGRYFWDVCIWIGNAQFQHLAIPNTLFDFPFQIQCFLSKNSKVFFSSLSSSLCFHFINNIVHNI